MSRLLFHPCWWSTSKHQLPTGNNAEIDILKIGLSGIVKRYGYQNAQELYRIYHKSHSSYVDYRE